MSILSIIILAIGLAMDAFAVSIAAVLGVIMGIKLKDIVHDNHHRSSLIMLYLVILMILAKKLFF